MTVHVVAKTLVPTPPPPHLTAFAWTEERGFLVPAWTFVARVLVPWDRAPELGFTQTRGWTCWIAPLGGPVYLADAAPVAS